MGLVTALSGILQALAQGNLKRLLAYSSVENMGIVLLGIGVGCVGRQAGSPAVAMLGLAAALFHMLNHAVFKGTLFLCAGEVLHAVGSVRLAHLGGLGKRMPFVGAAFALAAVGIAGLPPLAGFAGELTLAMALFHGLDLPGLLPRAGLAASMAGLAAVGGFALAALAKAHGLTFLGEPRPPAAPTPPAPAPPPARGAAPPPLPPAAHPHGLPGGKHQTAPAPGNAQGLGGQIPVGGILRQEGG